MRSDPEAENDAVNPGAALVAPSQPPAGRRPGRITPIERMDDLETLRRVADGLRALGSDPAGRPCEPASDRQPGERSQGSLRSKYSGSPMLSPAISSSAGLRSGGGSLRSPSRASSSEVK